MNVNVVLRALTFSWALHPYLFSPAGYNLYDQRKNKKAAIPPHKKFCTIKLNSRLLYAYLLFYSYRKKTEHCYYNELYILIY